jgi:hypothetical protein
MVEYRAYLTVQSANPRPAATWEALHATLDRQAAHYSPVVSYWPDRASDCFEVVMSTEARDQLEAAFTVTSALYLALRGAGLDGCHVSTTEIEEAEASHAVAAG